MKYLFLIIIIIVALVLISISLSYIGFFLQSAIRWYDSTQTTSYSSDPSLDFSNTTTNNPLGIRAEVIYDYDRSIMCPTGNCGNAKTFQLNLTSQKGIGFIAYYVCDGSSCVKNKLVDDTVIVKMENIPKNYTGERYDTFMRPFTIVHQYSGWNVGDKVHIMIKAYPTRLTPETGLEHFYKNTINYDLGESKIKDSAY